MTAFGNRRASVRHPGTLPAALPQTDMKPSKPTPSDPRRDAPGQGRTQRTKQNVPGPRLPHERDESADSQAAAPVDEAGKRAYRDAARGLPDTDRGPVLDRTYREKVATAPPSRRRR